jgi:hypothetical protein
MNMDEMKDSVASDLRAELQQFQERLESSMMFIVESKNKTLQESVTQ